MIQQSKMDRIKELVELLNKAGKSYYSEGRELMSNYEYDALYDELKKLECDNMNFSDILDIDIPQKIKTGDFICPTGFEDNYKEILRMTILLTQQVRAMRIKKRVCNCRSDVPDFFRIKRFLMCKNITMNPNSSRRFHTPKLWKAQKNISLLAVKESYLCLRL